MTYFPEYKKCSLLKYHNTTYSAHTIMNEAEAMTILGFIIGYHGPKNFKMRSGVIYTTNGYEPTEEEWDAISYLCSEWDYAYEAYK